MKYFCLTLILFLCLDAFSQNYSGKVVYKTSLDLSRLDGKETMEADLYRAAAKMSETFRYILLFNGQESSYEVEEFMTKEENSLAPMALRAGGGKGLYYKSSDQPYTLVKTEAYGEEVVIEVPGSLYSWELTEETREINGFTCYKATTVSHVEAPVEHLKDKTVHIEAWFAPEIPVCFGPKEYNGLPGLVLEVVAGNRTYTATEISLEKDRGELVINEPEGNRMTLEEVNEKGRKIYAKMFE